MQCKFMTKAALLASAVSMVVGVLPTSVAAQDYGWGYDDNAPPSGYDDYTPSNGYDDYPPQGGYYDAQPRDYGDELPPPPGYDAGPLSAEQEQQDRQYAAYAERWASEYCVKSGHNVAAGAIIGGIFGAVIGGIAGGPRHAGEGAAIGAGLGGVGGAAVAASSQGATSPGCPPGYVVRNDAPAFYYAAPGPTPYYYYAPPSYNPWVWDDNQWMYRPYPYHTWYYSHYWRGGSHRYYDYRYYR